ncbi:MAG: hypothetical protein ACFFFB_07685 [Candidatus Heimdallarchaeota archaeon]
MNQFCYKSKEIEETPQNHLEILKDIYTKIKKTINGKREIMYSDIINLLVRNNYSGDNFNRIVIWCNYNIKQGNLFVKFE